MYETVQDEEGAYIKLYDLCSKVNTHNIFGRMSKIILPYLLAIHPFRRSIFLVSLPLDHSLGGFAKDLAAWAAEYTSKSNLKLQIMASTHSSALMAADSLTEAGCGSITHHAALLPSDTNHETPRGFTDRPQDGESSADLVKRLEGSILEIEASMQPVLVVAHQAPCRALRTYFMNLDVSEHMRPNSSEGAASLSNNSRSVLELEMSESQVAFIERVLTLPTV
uniref:Uncharacterized protein n=1 Tax=Haptolina ericina TaxID=156174 RepID=A0A7S3FKP2_9EUKA